MDRRRRDVLQLAVARRTHAASEQAKRPKAFCRSALPSFTICDCTERLTYASILTLALKNQNVFLKNLSLRGAGYARAADCMHVVPVLAVVMASVVIVLVTQIKELRAPECRGTYFNLDGP